MTHPNPQIQKNQEEFLKQCQEDRREFHARYFRIGNATCRYYLTAHAAGDTGMKDWMKEHLSDDDYNTYMLLFQ